jgi:uncharacterized protein YndB with AHSA1/START domain
MTTQVYRIYIKATAQAIWDAITTPEWSDRYGYGNLVDYDLKPGGAYKVHTTDDFKNAAPPGVTIPDVFIEGEVLEADPPHKLVTTFRMHMTEPLEPYTTITHEITEVLGGVCRLTLTHVLDGSPQLAAVVGGEMEDQGAGGGHAWALSDLKSLLETGKSFRN